MNGAMHIKTFLQSLAPFKHPKYVIISINIIIISCSGAT